MRHGGHRPAERLVDVDLTGRVGQMVVAPDDVGDAHVVVVDHDGQHIHRCAVGSHEDAIVEILVGPGDAALYLVVEHRLAVERSAKAPARAGCRAEPRSGHDPANGRRSGADASRDAPPRASPRVPRVSHSSDKRDRSRASVAPPACGARHAEPGRRRHRPNRGRASAARQGWRRWRPSSSARGRYPRCAAAWSRRSAARRAS